MSHFTQDQLNELEQYVSDHPMVQYLMKRIEEQDAELISLREQLGEALSKTKLTPMQTRAAMGQGLLTSPTATLAAVQHSALRYIELTANLGSGARRLPSGELIIDLDDLELKPLLPTNLPTANMYSILKDARRHTRRVFPHEREFMDWPKSRPHSFVLLSRR
jgi:hypothetical protein